MTPQELAAEFCLILNDWLAVEELAEVNRRNATEKYQDAGLCATHDFCDPDQAMIDAMKNLGREYLGNDADDSLINEAWDIAREKNFVA